MAKKKKTKSKRNNFKKYIWIINEKLPGCRGKVYRHFRKIALLDASHRRGSEEFY